MAEERAAWVSSELAARVVGRRMAVDQGATAAEVEELSRLGSDVAEGRVLLGDVAANYLAWLDVATAVLHEDAAGLGTDPAVLGEATETLRAISQGSILAMIARFDTAHQKLRGELAADQARLHHLAHHDQLTGLPNRHLLFHRLADTVAAATDSLDQEVRAAVFYLDVDWFKTINDTHGHGVGDHLLRVVADRLREHTHPADTLARIGGDEFVLICPHVRTPDDAQAVSARLHHRLAAPVDGYPQAVLTLSIATPSRIQAPTRPTSSPAPTPPCTRTGPRHEPNQTPPENAPTAARPHRSGLPRRALCFDVHVMITADQSLTLHHTSVSMSLVSKGCGLYGGCMTPAQALQYVLLAARDQKVMLTKTAKMRLLYLSDLRAQRHGDPTSGIVWERAMHGPFNRSVGFFPRDVEVDLSQERPYCDHARAVVSAYARLGNDDLGLVCKGSAPMRKAPKPGDILDLSSTSTNDTSSPITNPSG